MNVYMNYTAEKADALLADHIPDPGDAIVLRNQNSGHFCVYLESGYASLRRCVRRNVGSDARYTLAVCGVGEVGKALQSACCLDEDGAVVPPAHPRPSI
jgi:hypothetical protein